MDSARELSVKRFGVFLRDVLEGAAVRVLGEGQRDKGTKGQSGPGVGLEVGVAQFADARAPLVGVEEAVRASFEPVSPPWAWGPKWSTAWFRVRGVVPRAEEVGAALEDVWLRFSSGTEAMVWGRAADGTGWRPVQGMDINRDRVRLSDVLPRMKSGERFEIYIEAACNHPFGVTGFEWDDSEVHARWRSATPGRFEVAELVEVRGGLQELAWKYAFALGLLKELPEDSPRARVLEEALRAATNLVGDAEPFEGAAEAERVLDAAIEAPASSATVCHAVGHAHLDTAWLWPLRETKRKAMRSFSNVIRLMEREPEFCFLASQTQQYAWVEEDAPALFAEIAKRVKEGRWEAGGGMWIEPDVNVPSGESLARQMLHADRWWRSRFGEKGAQRHLYIPDTFGYNAALPQIMRLGGLDTFITNKLWWNQSNPFPHTTFRWRGIDGSEVIGHNTPGQDYNAVNTPKELRRGETNTAKRRAPMGVAAGVGKEAAPVRWMQPFGYGDGGGGPTARSIRYAQLSKGCEGLPAVRMSTATAFCDALHADIATIRAAGGDVPLWIGELYLELHRGTLTTQAWIKQANRRAEQRLRLAELLISGAGETVSEDDRAALDKAWKLLLLQQFHDILPGSSIGRVYEDSRRDFAEIERLVGGIIERGATVWAGKAGAASAGGDKSGNGTRDAGGVVINPGRHTRRAVIERGGGLEVVEVAGLTACGVDAARVDAGAWVEVSADRLSNGIVEARLDGRGRIVSLKRVGGRDVCIGRGGEALAMNDLALYEDRPIMWDAWDIDPTHEEKRVDDEDAVEIEVVRADPVRGEVRVTRKLGAKSRVEMVYRLDAASPRLDIAFKVQWRERRRLLRALFPTGILAANATHDIQYGVYERPTHRNSTVDAARFEVCGHRFVDLSEPGRGLAVLTDCKYGYSCYDGVIGVSLLRSPVHPDPEADQGEHEFTLSVMPHDGDWRSASVAREAEALNTPLVLVEGGGGAWSPFVVESSGAAEVEIDCVKAAEDDDRLIVRLHEHHGGHGEVVIRWGLDVTGVERLDLLERGLEGAEVEHAGRETRVVVRPFEIVTLGVRV